MENLSEKVAASGGYMKKLELVCGAVLGAGLTYWLWKKQPLHNFNAGKNSMPEANKAQLRDAFNQKTAAIAKEFPTTNVADVNTNFDDIELDANQIVPPTD